MLFGDQFTKEVKVREEQLRYLDEHLAMASTSIFPIATLRLSVKGAMGPPATPLEGDASTSQCRRNKKAFSPKERGRKQ